MTTPAIKNRLELDPQDFFGDGLEGLAIIKPITYESATQTLGTIPANSLISTIFVVRTTAWDAITTFQIGKSGDTDWLVTTAQANVNGVIDSGEAGNVESIAGGKVVTSDTDVVLTLNQGAATQGAGYVVVTYKELIR